MTFTRRLSVYDALCSAFTEKGNTLSISTSFEFTVENVGKVPIDFISVALKEITTKSSETEVTAIDIYENYVYESSLNSCWIEAETHPENLDIKGVFSMFQPQICYQSQKELLPGHRVTLKVRVYGKILCSGISIIVEYGKSGESIGQVFTRQLTIPILVTVCMPINMRNAECLPYSNDTLSLESCEASIPGNSDEQISDSQFIFTFDVENTWDEPIWLYFDIYDSNIVRNLVNGKLLCAHEHQLYTGITKRLIRLIQNQFTDSEDLPDKRATRNASPHTNWKAVHCDKRFSFG